MKIEILTRQMDKKGELLTYLARQVDFASGGGFARAKDMDMEFGQDYILVSTSSADFGEWMVKTLVTVRPVPFAPAFYEPVTDQKMIVTASSLEINSIIPNLSRLEHLDLERGELAGFYETAWQSRDVAVMARCEVMVQGGLAVARIKFAGHFRESEWHCRACLDKITITELLGVFTGEAHTSHAGPVAGAALAQGHSLVSDTVCSDFINCCPGEVAYMKESGFYTVSLGGASGRIEFKPQTNPSKVDVTLVIEKAAGIDPQILGAAMVSLDIKNVTVNRKIEGLLISPDVLIKELGFIKDKSFYRFTCVKDNLQASYDIKERELAVSGVISVREASIVTIEQFFSEVDRFCALVMSYAS